MSGICDRAYCPRCETKDSLFTWNESVPFEHGGATCMRCGFYVEPRLVILTKKELAGLRKDELDDEEQKEFANPLTDAEKEECRTFDKLWSILKRR